jgi:hypothetical protein
LEFHAPQVTPNKTAPRELLSLPSSTMVIGFDSSFSSISSDVSLTSIIQQAIKLANEYDEDEDVSSMRNLNDLKTEASTNISEDGTSTYPKSKNTWRPKFNFGLKHEAEATRNDPATKKLHQQLTKQQRPGHSNNSTEINKIVHDKEQWKTFQRAIREGNMSNAMVRQKLNSLVEGRVANFESSNAVPSIDNHGLQSQTNETKSSPCF